MAPPTAVALLLPLLPTTLEPAETAVADELAPDVDPSVPALDLDFECPLPPPVPVAAARLERLDDGRCFEVMARAADAGVEDAGELTEDVSVFFLDNGSSTEERLLERGFEPLPPPAPSESPRS